jgi:hypothetical protein
MNKIEFCNTSIKWIQMCLESIRYLVMVNGEGVGPIVPCKGLRQGDMLSPYLFIFCAEGLITLMNKYERKDDIHCVKVCRGAPSLTHLLFADNCFLFFRAGEIEARCMKRILNKYEQALGQAIN